MLSCDTVEAVFGVVQRVLTPFHNHERNMYTKHTGDKAVIETVNFSGQIGTENAMVGLSDNNVMATIFWNASSI